MGKPKMPAPAIALFPVPGIPLVDAETDLANVIATALSGAGLQPQTGDVLTIAQKIVSKAEGCVVDLSKVTPSDAARELAEGSDKDPRLVELILQESRRVVRHSAGVIVVEHRLGIILANAGIDRSNVAGDEESVLLLPKDPDASAAELRRALEKHFGVHLGIVISDSVGRPWRLGTTGIAIGCSGMTALTDMRGKVDMFGRVLQVAEVATADCVAGAAGLIMGEGAESVPVVLVRGVDARASEQTAKTILRPEHENLFQ